jgi:hypothetical protein
LCTSSPPNITSSQEAHNERRAPLRAPTREDLTRSGVILLKDGGRNKADLLIVDIGDGPLVVKDFSRRGWRFRLLGRLQIGRECRAYRWLGPTPGLPRFAGRIDAHALAIEKVDGEQLGFSTRRTERGPELYRRLGKLLGGLHAKGLVHLDMRGAENVLLCADGRLVIVDLASAIWLRPGGLAHRLLFRSMKSVDDSALLKWKRVLEAGPYTPEEQAAVDRHNFWRSLWPFNRGKLKLRRGSGE